MATDLIGTDPQSIGEALHSLEGMDELRNRLSGHEAWLVGGAVRDLLLGGTRADLDVVVEGDASEVASLIGAEPASYERFGTASALLGGHRVDIASARRETYAAPGALPEVEPASLAEDLGRRDFTVNAMALPLSGEPVLVDPHGGKADLEAGLLRVLHPLSFTDDPTRALRAARYAARLGLEPEPETEALLKVADLATVSRDRVDAELRRLAGDESGPNALAILHRWGLAGIDEEAAGRLRAARSLLSDPAWAATVEPLSLYGEAARPGDGARIRVAELTAARPERPSAGVALARSALPIELALARIAGAEWLDAWVRDWRHIKLEIDGDDLLEAGVPQGPAIGRGLDAAHAARVDGEIGTREEELRVALAAAATT